jgi:hypothetical protein
MLIALIRLYGSDPKHAEPRLNQASRHGMRGQKAEKRVPDCGESAGRSADRRLAGSRRQKPPVFPN